MRTRVLTWRELVEKNVEVVEAALSFEPTNSATLTAARGAI